MLDHLPANTVLTRDAHRYGYHDSYVVALGPGAVSVDDVVPAFFRAPPPWFDPLLRLRNRLVTVFGLKTGSMEVGAIRPPFRVGQSIGLFRIVERTDDEIVFGEDDRHLDFRVSLLLERTSHGTNLAVSSVVRINNALGRFYFAAVKPFHRLLVPIMAQNTARLLRAARETPGEAR